MERPRLLDAIRHGIGQPQPDLLHQTTHGLTTATPENLKDLLSMPDPPQRVWWEKAQMEFCLIPAGEFVMGSADSDQGAQDNEKPQHKVYLDACYIGRYPVTNRQYALFVRATGHRAPYSEADWAKSYNWDRGHNTPPVGKEDHSVVLVSWEDARAYCEWAGLRLPAEAEWEKAARGVDWRIYPWGNIWDPQKCNTFKSGKGSTTPVGIYSPAGDSPYGCADMAGNVWEWVADWFDAGYYRISLSRNPQGPVSGGGRVLRGGAWSINRYWARSAYRDRGDPDYLGDNRGFRVGLPRTFSL